jgi:hypothetical protein
MPGFDDFQRQMEVKLKEWGAAIEKLRAQATSDKIGVAKAQTKSHLFQQAEQLEATRVILRQKGMALRTLGETERAKARTELQASFAAFERDLKAAIGRRPSGSRGA